MSNEIETTITEPSEHNIALFLQDNEIDKLTDILVESLYEALRIVREDAPTTTFH
jgi:hypothetical protein